LIDYSADYFVESHPQLKKNCKKLNFNLAVRRRQKKPPGPAAAAGRGWIIPYPTQF
jgi:hypothetical protein